MEGSSMILALPHLLWPICEYYSHENGPSHGKEAFTCQGICVKGILTNGDFNFDN